MNLFIINMIKDILNLLDLLNLSKTKENKKL